MHQRERMAVIAEILKKNGFVTVHYLTEELHYSTATINRDLNVMQHLNLVKRSYGGVELLKATSIPLQFRYHKMKPQKNLIGKAAVGLVVDGDTVFIDGTTTSQQMGKYLVERKNIRVITNNLSLAAFLSEHGVKVVVLGGEVVEPPAMVCGTETADCARRYNADKAFFSVGGVSEDGRFGGGGLYLQLERVMIENSRQSFLLADHEKVGVSFPVNSGTFTDLAGVISDYAFSESTKQRYPDTVFYQV